jgi:hypothetical protein
VSVFAQLGLSVGFLLLGYALGLWHGLRIVRRVLALASPRRRAVEVETRRRRRVSR